MRILVQFPTRSRPEKAVEVGRMYAAKASGKHDITMRFTVDDNDPTVTASFLTACCELDGECKGLGSWFNDVAIASHRNKVEAVNDIPRDGWDICIVASDDMIPQVDGWDDVIAKEFQLRYPDLDGSLWFNDGYVGDKLNTIICVGHKYFMRFGYLYNSIYESMWCDNEFTEVGKMLNRQTYIDQVIIKHEHPANTGCPKDDLYIRNDEPWKRDYARYLKRKAKRFGLMLLDVLICTLPSRRHKFDRVFSNLHDQIVRGGYEENVTVIYNEEQGISIGAKRNELIASSRAEYVCFVDDDDDVSADYVALLVAAIGDCDVDSVGIRGSVMMPGGIWKRFEHDLCHKQYTSNQDGTMYYRPPNHLNPVRRSIAVRFSFIDENHGEDTDYAMRMCDCGAIASCRMAAEHPIYYYIPSSLQNESEVPSTEGAKLAQEGSTNRAVIPDNVKTSTWRREGPRRPRR